MHAKAFVGSRGGTILYKTFPNFYIFIPPAYEVYRGYIVFAFSVTMFVC